MIVKLPYHMGDLEKGNFANDAIDNIKDSQFPSKVGGSKVPKSETVCNSSSSSSPSCLKAKYAADYTRLAHKPFAVNSIYLLCRLYAVVI